MQQVTLGATGPTVAQMGVGTCFMAGAGQEGVTRMVRDALDLGITHFDTAADYSRGNDETMLGIALRGHRDRAMLATKVGYMPEPNGHRDVAAMMRQLDGSLARLQTDHVDLIQIHEADFLKWWVDDTLNLDELRSHMAPRLAMDVDYDFAGAPLVAFLDEVRRQGKARYVGLTGKNARRLARILAEVQVDTLMLAHDQNVILRNGDSGLFSLMAERGVGCILGAVLMKGWLAVPQTAWRDAPPPWMTPEFSRAYFAYLDLQREAGLPLVELSLRWLLATVPTPSILVGCANSEQVRENLAIFERGPLPADLQAAITAIGIEHPLIYQGRTEL